MKRLVLRSSVLVAIACVVLLAAAMSGGTARGQPDPTPTPVPDPCEGVCITGFWQATYRNDPGDVVGHCGYELTQSGASTIWGEISCTHGSLGVLSALLDQGPLTWHDVINFAVPLYTVEHDGTVSPDGGSDEGTWVCTAGCEGSGTYTSQRIEPHAEDQMPPSGPVTVNTSLNDELTVPEGALPPGTTVTADFDTLPAAPPEGLVALSRAFVLGPEGASLDPPATLVIHYTIEDLGGTADPETLRVYVYNSGTGVWDFLGGTVDTIQQTLTVEICHFSTFAAIGSPLPPATPTPTPTATATHTATATATNTPLTPTPTATPGPPVGGIVGLPALTEPPAAASGAPGEGSGWPAGGYAALAAVGVAAAAALAAGGCYARRRWLR